jgi:hypothetical protein
MERQGDEVHIETTEARGGSTPHIVRYVLAISLFLAIAALTLIWVTGALTTPQAPAKARSPTRPPRASNHSRSASAIAAAGAHSLAPLIMKA